MILCGLTGGVGMGKSTAAGFFSSRGVRVVDTDDIARQMVQPGQPALAEIKSHFGGQVLAPDGTLSRHELARVVFSDPVARQKLEEILHPRIRSHWLSQVEAWRGQGCALALVVIPLLFETRAEPHFDRVICVACSRETQQHRLIARGWSTDQIAQRITAQLPVEQKIARSQFVLWTEGVLPAHELQVTRVLERL